MFGEKEKKKQTRQENAHYLLWKQEEKKRIKNSCNRWSESGTDPARRSGAGLLFVFFKRVAYLKKEKKNLKKQILGGKTKGSCGQSELGSLVHFRD